MACVRKRLRGKSEKWVVDYRDRQGKRHWESFRTRKEADAALAERVQQLKKGNYVAPGKEKTFEGLASSIKSASAPSISA